MLIPAVFGQLPELSEEQLQWLGVRVFENECNQRFECLTSWNSGEDFPSLGIGHFIWYQQGQTEAFEETFPSLLEYYQASDSEIPEWIKQLPTPDSPWQSRDQFFSEQSSPSMQELRQFLAESVELQIAFIVERLHRSIPEILENLPPSQRQASMQNFYQVANSAPPYGLYALIDYVHFKGTGIAQGERYLGEGWGLLQVLQQMPKQASYGEHEILQSFVDSAAAVLQRRVANAPTERREQRWLKGWENRLTTYLPAN